VCFSVASFSFTHPATAGDTFPWLIKTYKHSHLSDKQKAIYRDAFFETSSFLIYGHTGQVGPHQFKHLNAWTNCVLQTRNRKSWTPNLNWTFAKDLDKSGAYVLYNSAAPIICKSHTEAAGKTPKFLKLFSYEDWLRFSLKEKATYVSGFVDMAATLEHRKKEFSGKSSLRDIQIVIEAIGIEGILDEVLRVKFETKFPLPWSIARGFGAARNRVFQNK
jgi:hypothetical protein